jgi:hypothetical protein
MRCHAVNRSTLNPAGRQAGSHQAGSDPPPDLLSSSNAIRRYHQLQGGKAKHTQKTVTISIRLWPCKVTVTSCEHCPPMPCMLLSIVINIWKQIQHQHSAVPSSASSMGYKDIHSSKSSTARAQTLEQVAALSQPALT